MPLPGGPGTSQAIGTTNADWATLLLQDAGLPVTANNIDNILRWMTAEEPTSNWWDRNNPLNASLGTSASDGTGSYPDLSTGAAYTARMIQQSNMSGIYQALANNADPSAFSAAVVNSPWASSHYGGDPNHIADIGVPGPVTAGNFGSTLVVPSASNTGVGEVIGTTPGTWTAATQGNAPYLQSNVPGIPSQPPPFPDFTANPYNEISRVLSWTTEFGGWALFTFIVLLFGILLLTIGLLMLVVLLVSPVAGPVGEVVGGGIIGRATKRVRGGATSSAPKAPAMSAGENEEYDFQRREARNSDARQRRMTGETDAQRSRRHAEEGFGSYDQAPRPRSSGSRHRAGHYNVDAP